MTIFSNVSVKIRTIDDEHVTFVVKRNLLKVYRKPMTKQEFIHGLTHQSYLDLVGEEEASSPPSS